MIPERGQIGGGRCLLYAYNEYIQNISIFLFFNVTLYVTRPRVNQRFLFRGSLFSYYESGGSRSGSTGTRLKKKMDFLL